MVELNHFRLKLQMSMATQPLYLERWGNLNQKVILL